MLALLLSFLSLPFLQGLKSTSPAVKADTSHVLSSHEFSLEDRYGNTFVNDVFKDNILLTIRYTEGDKIDPAKINWSEIEKPFDYKLTLTPGQTFAFHDDVLPQYTGKVNKTTNSHFNSDEGFKSDGYLVGDGVCHLASLLYWVAKDAGLASLAPTRHDFAPVPDVPKEFGTAIFDMPGTSYSNEEQNLYITNDKKSDIAFDFHYDGKDLSITATQSTE